MIKKKKKIPNKAYLTNLSSSSFFFFFFGGGWGGERTLPILIKKNFTKYSLQGNY